MNKIEIDILKKFISFPLYRTDDVFEIFREEKQWSFYYDQNNSKRKFLYIEWKKNNKVLLAAHADTFFDEVYGFEKNIHSFSQEWNVLKTSSGYGLWSDDRAGCAILWLLKNTWHSLLITDWEEHWQKWTKYLKKNFQELFVNIQKKHQFIIQFDRRWNKWFKTYDVWSADFIAYIKKQTLYRPIKDSWITDIWVLCQDICWVNLSIWYYNEHTNQEKIHIDEWLHTYEIAKKILSQDTLPRFVLPSVN